MASFIVFNQSGSVQNQPKLRPTLLDQKQFNAVLSRPKSYAPDLPLPFGDERGELQKAAAHIYSMVKGHCGEKRSYDHEAAQALYNVLLAS
ncbi:MAG: hypothetical protein U5Q44_12195 [Dehalococcoidia bacterium]|nr:hypothetical protein [Dehalococcoidia bacterium]